MRSVNPDFNFVGDREFFVSPAESFGYGTHVHGAPNFVFQWILEGSRVWQLLPPSREAAERMLPVEVSTDDASYAFSRAPVEVADEFPVFLAELGPGDLLYVPVDYIHLVYSHSDSVPIAVHCLR